MYKTEKCLQNLNKTKVLKLYQLRKSALFAFLVTLHNTTQSSFLLHLKLRIFSFPTKIYRLVS